MLDRSAFEDRLRGNAERADRISVTLPICGDVVSIRQPNKHQIQRSWSATGNDEDAHFLGMVNLLRHILVDDDGQPIPRSYDEARRWFTSLDDADAAAVMEGIETIVARMGAGGTPEDPKESSSNPPTS